MPVANITTYLNIIHSTDIRTESEEDGESEGDGDGDGNVDVVFQPKLADDKCLNILKTYNIQPETFNNFHKLTDTQSRKKKTTKKKKNKGKKTQRRRGGSWSFKDRERERGRARTRSRQKQRNKKKKARNRDKEEIDASSPERESSSSPAPVPSETSSSRSTKTETDDKWLEDRIKRGIATYLIYYHDETILHTNEYYGFSWSDGKVCGLRPKSAGQGYNISDMISMWDGPLRDDNGNSVRYIQKIGGDEKRGQKYWNCQQFTNQCVYTLKIHRDKFKLYTEHHIIHPCTQTSSI